MDFVPQAGASNALAFNSSPIDKHGFILVFGRRAVWVPDNKPFPCFLLLPKVYLPTAVGFTATLTLCHVPVLGEFYTGYPPRFSLFASEGGKRADRGHSTPEVVQAPFPFKGVDVVKQSESNKKVKKKEGCFPRQSAVVACALGSVVWPLPEGMRRSVITVVSV